MLQLLCVWHGRGKPGAPDHSSAGRRKVPLEGTIQQQQGWPFGHLGWIWEDCRRLRVKLFLIYSPLSFSPSPNSPLLMLIPFSPPSSCQPPKNQLRCNLVPAGFVIYLQIALPPFSAKPCTIVHTHAHEINFWPHQDKCCIRITCVTSSKLWFKLDRWKMPCWPNAH